MCRQDTGGDPGAVWDGRELFEGRIRAATDGEQGEERRCLCVSMCGCDVVLCLAMCVQWSVEAVAEEDMEAEPAELMLRLREAYERRKEG